MITNNFFNNIPASTIKSPSIISPRQQKNIFLSTVPPGKIQNYWSSKSKHAKKLLPTTFVPSCYSVICGRTKQCFDSVGNRRFRATVGLFLEDYSAAKSKVGKSRIVTRVYDLIREANGGMGAFVAFENGRWYECSERVSREKIGALFRDFLHEDYKSSAKAKQARKNSLGKTGKSRQSNEQLKSHELPEKGDSEDIDFGFRTFYDVSGSQMKCFLSLDGDVEDCVPGEISISGHGLAAV